MNDKFYKLFGFQINFTKGLIFSFILGFINSIIIVLVFNRVDDSYKSILSFIMLIIETIVFLGCRYYSIKRSNTK